MWINPIGSAVFHSLTSYPSLSSQKKFHRRSWGSVIHLTSLQSSEKPHAFWRGLTVHVHIVTSCRYYMALSFNMEMLMPRRPWFWKSRKPQLIPLCAWSSHKKILSLLEQFAIYSHACLSTNAWPGAILQGSHSGRDTTLCINQKEFFEKVYYFLSSN